MATKITQIDKNGENATSGSHGNAKNENLEKSRTHFLDNRSEKLCVKF